MHTKTEIRKQKAHNFQQCSISTVKVSNTNSRVILANYNFDTYGIKTLFWKPDKAPLKSSVDLHIHTHSLSLLFPLLPFTDWAAGAKSLSFPLCLSTFAKFSTTLLLSRTFVIPTALLLSGRFTHHPLSQEQADAVPLFPRGEIWPLFHLSQLRLRSSFGWKSDLCEEK